MFFNGVNLEPAKRMLACTKTTRGLIWFLKAVPRSLIDGGYTSIICTVLQCDKVVGFLLYDRDTAGCMSCANAI